MKNCKIRGKCDTQEIAKLSFPGDFFKKITTKSHKIQHNQCYLIEKRNLMPQKVGVDDS
jgi:hypothetical protein